jgi:hypothetical protein
MSLRKYVWIVAGLAQARLVNDAARGLSGFTSAFTRAQDLFDFVDAMEKKEGSDYKIKGKGRHPSQKGVKQLWLANRRYGTEVFRLFASLNQCRHIYFGGCHTPIISPC